MQGKTFYYNGKHTKFKIFTGVAIQSCVTQLRVIVTQLRVIVTQLRVSGQLVLASTILL